MSENESYIQSLFAKRLGGERFGKDTTIYKFEKIKRAKRAALSANPEKELFDMGVGEPDEMAFPKVVKALQLEADAARDGGGRRHAQAHRLHAHECGRARDACLGPARARRELVRHRPPAARGAAL